MHKKILYLLNLLALSSCGSLPFQKQKERDDSSNAAPAKYSLLVFGDSIASGMFAGTFAGQDLRDRDVADFAKLFAISKRYPDDSEEFYTEAQKVSADPGQTAFAGNRDYSFGPRLAQQLSDRVDVVDFAIPGATTPKVASQITTAKQSTRLKNDSAQFIVINVGANDFCNRSSVESIRAEFAKRLSEIINANKNAKIAVFPVPNVPSILILPEAVAFRAPSTSMNCSQMRQEFKLCMKVPLAAGSPAAAAEPFIKEIAELNQALKAEVERQKQSLTDPRNLVFAEYTPITISTDLLAIDCFHLNPKGHRTLADASWPILMNMNSH